MAKDTTAHSYYAATRNLTLDLPDLQGEENVDVCIIGGGFTGINTALELTERSMTVALLEAHHIGWGASGRNGGQLIRGVGHDVDQFLPTLGEEGVRELKRMGLEAVDIVRQRIERYNIACDLTWGYADLANKPHHLQGFQEEIAELQSLGYPHALQLVAREDMAKVIDSDRYLGALIDNGSGHLHPLNLVLGEAAAALNQWKVRLFERSPVTAIDYGSTLTIHTAKGRVKSNNLVIGCNAYIQGLNKNLSNRVLPAGSYIIATEPLPPELCNHLLPHNRAVCDQRVALDYFRLSADHRLLFGGACHYSGRDPKDIASYMRPKMLKVFPQLESARIDFAWGGMIGISANRLPQIGRLRKHPNVFYALAYSGHGVNTTHLGARLIAEAICTKESRGLDLFARVPHIAFPGGPLLRSPLLALGMLWYRLKDML